jgi:hypothetical protein
MDWIYVAQDTVQTQAFVNTTLKLNGFLMSSVEHSKLHRLKSHTVLQQTTVWITTV